MTSSMLPEEERFHAGLGRLSRHVMPLFPVDRIVQAGERIALRPQRVIGGEWVCA